MGKKGGILAKQKISMSIDEEVYNNFKDYCKRNGMKVSTKVELLMKDSVQNTTLKRFIKS